MTPDAADDRPAAPPPLRRPRGSDRSRQPPTAVPRSTGRRDGTPGRPEINGTGPHGTEPHGGKPNGTEPNGADRNGTERNGTERHGGRRNGSAPSPPAARATGTPPSGLTGPLRLMLTPVTGALKLGRQRDGGGDQRLRVDWPQCKAHGLCAELAPEVIRLDEWGYPRIDPVRLVGDELAAVRKAVLACPTLALKLVDPSRG